MEEILIKIKELERYLYALNAKVAGIPLYKIIISLIVIFLSVILRKLIAYLILKVLTKITLKTKTDVDELIVKAFVKPFSYFIVASGFYLSLFILDISKIYADKFFKTLSLLIFGWAIIRFLSLFHEKIVTFFVKVGGKEFAEEVGDFILKILKAFVVVVVGASLLQEWGVNIGAILASVGLLGLAVSLAAKDTFENILSGLIILLDKPVKVGETVKVKGFTGSVEEIGLRSTKIRTFDKSLVTIPNRDIVNDHVENFTRRNKRRVRFYIGLVYSTKREQLENILRDIRKLLKEHYGVARDEKFYVYFENYGDSSLNILIQYYANTNDYEDYLKIIEDINLKIMEIVERNGSSFAFPSRSIYIEKMPKP
ncbi:MAG: mechanosensitive ion channel family protein [Aquifex sp.]|nr:MAG: mechanosensitive ion channel family protein [Aquifex sp.]